MQMYEGLPIITNKVTIDEQQGIPHHLLGFIGLDEEPWRVGLFREKAGQIIKEIRSRGRLPVLVGGTHYYAQALLFPDVTTAGDKDKLTALESANTFPILEMSTEVMLEKLREVDPVMAHRWHPKERRKIRRSLEIFLTTGKKASDVYYEQRAAVNLNQLDGLGEDFYNESVTSLDSTLLFWVHAERDVLKARLDARVDKMMTAGLLDEVKSMSTFLKEKFEAGITVDRGRAIWVSIGFKEFEAYLEALEKEGVSQKQMDTICRQSVLATQAATRQYANRQVRWIRLSLMTALAERDALSKLYLLDGTDITKWTEAVSDPAIKVAAAFLKGDELQSPEELSDAARVILAPEEGLAKKPNVWVRKTCEMCHMTAVTDLQWEIHLKSRKHRGLSKKKERLTSGGKISYQKQENASEEDIP